MALALALSLLLTACSDPGNPLETKPTGARMTPKEAIGLARTAAQTDGMDLADYKEPEFTYGSVRARTWRIFFGSKDGSSDKHFYIYIDDQTEETRIFSGE